MNPFKKCVKLIYVQNLNIFAGVMELADVTDSKSVGSNTVWVRVPPPAPNTEAPVGCLCVWLNRTGLEAGETKRSCGAFCPAGERKQSGRAARSASKGRFERRVPPPAPNTEAPVGRLCVWLSRTGLEFCRCRLISSSDKARSMPYKSPPVFRDFPPVYLLDCGKGGTLQKKMRKRKDIFDDD